jgi:nitroreductase
MSNNIFSQKPVKKFRKTDLKINDIFWKRWSPRALSEEGLSQDLVFQVLEAARFAPSSFNEQPWRFIYSLSPSQPFFDILNCLVEFNQTWAKRAGALIVILSKKNFSHNNQVNQTADFDTGAAWQNLGLQASLLNLVAHGMSGVNFEKLRNTLKVSQDYNIIAVVALGHPGDINDLPEDLKKQEEPSSRLDLSKIISQDKFNFK